MSTFYHTLADHYDDLFPAEGEIVQFLAETFRGAPGLVVDAACGTGNYTAALTARGLSVAGFDADESMINRARCCGREGRFLTGSLEHLDTLQEQMPFPWGGLFCIGNSLPHLQDLSAVEHFFTDAARALTPLQSGAPGTSGASKAPDATGAPLVVQMINFARFAPEAGASTPSADPSPDIRELPAIERPGIMMRREYHPHPSPGRTVFHVELEEAGKPAVTADTTLLTLDRDQLGTIAAQAGFTELQWYGGYDRSPYDRERSFLLLFSARARGSLVT